MSARPPLPAPFRERFAGLEEQGRPPRSEDPFHGCFGCGPGHPNGLEIRCFRTDTGVLSPVLVDRRWEGPPGAAHGGIVAAYLDEILAGAVVRATDRIAVTGELTVRYVRPVPLETPLVGRARVVATHGRCADVEGSLEGLATASLFATGRGRFFFLPDQRPRPRCAP